MLVHVEAGMRLGRYKLIQPVGVGGMAEVWEALDEVLKRTVAIKLVLPSFTTEKEFTNRFLREARLAAYLEHPNILPLYDVGTFEDRPFLITPLLLGGRLLDKMNEGVEDTLALEWLAALASALDHAHSHQVIHRDVKPANVLFDKKGKPYLSDFGIAKSLEESTVLTQDGAVVGTPAYMSPEQAMSVEVSAASDQYSLGILAYRLFCGQLPFDKKTPTPVLLHKTIYETPPPPSRYRPSLGARVDAVFQRVLDKKPERRFRTCGEFVRSLSGALVASNLIQKPMHVGPDPDSEAMTAPEAALENGKVPETGFTTQPAGPSGAQSTPVVPEKQRPPSGRVPAASGLLASSPHSGKAAFIAGIAATAVLVIVAVVALKGLRAPDSAAGPSQALAPSAASESPQPANPGVASSAPSPTGTPASFKTDAPEDRLALAPTSPPPIVAAPLVRTARPTQTSRPPVPTATRLAATPTAVPPTATVPPLPPSPTAAVPVATKPAATPRPSVGPAGPGRIEEATLSTVTARVKDPSLVLTLKFDRLIQPPAPGLIRVESILSGASGSFLLRSGSGELACQHAGTDSVTCSLPLKLFEDDKRRQLKPESELEVTVSIGSKRILRAVRFLQSE